jgi:hypothetical protein
MFKCEKCETLEKEVAFLRDTNAKLVDRIMALADAKAYSAVNSSVVEGKDYFGGGDDEMIAYNEYGQKILVKS